MSGKEGEQHTNKGKSPTSDKDKAGSSKKQQQGNLQKPFLGNPKSDNAVLDLKKETPEYSHDSRVKGKGRGGTGKKNTSRRSPRVGSQGLVAGDVRDLLSFEDKLTIFFS